MAPRLLLALSVLALWACGRVCPEEQPLVEDGGVQRCVLSTDCLRPSGVLICSSTDDQKRDCVACVDTRCIRFVPQVCP